MFDIDSNHSTLLLELKSEADFINKNYSSSSITLITADSRISSKDGRVGRLCGQEESSTLCILRRSSARWSSGDHFRGAAACAFFPHDGQVVDNDHALQSRHCCSNCLAIILTLSKLLLLHQNFALIQLQHLSHFPMQTLRS